MKKINLSQIQLNLLLSLVFTVFFNLSFFSKTLVIYPLNSENILFLASITFVIFLATYLILNLIVWKKIYKITSYFLFLISALAAYVMDSYSTVFDENMLLNIIKTDVNESLDLVTIKLFIYLVFMFILPCFLLSRVNIKEASVKKELKQKGANVVAALVIVFFCVLTFSKNYATFFREHKPLRYYANPTYWIYSTGKFASSFFKKSDNFFTKIGEASIVPLEDRDRELIILVVGETARRDRFSLNGYTRKTNLLLEKQEDLVSFKNVTSCGTSTAVSVPCMFSNLGRDNFSVDKANNRENLLDVLNHTKDVNVLWRDNNSDSKGVASRVTYQDYKTPQTNTICDVECRDEGMLVGLQEHIDNVNEKDIVIVLHQMGNHGPAYYKRYPKEFEIFSPACQTSELAKCSKEEIDNVYDNVIVYTDYFLDKVIKLLQKNSDKFHTGMLYVSDHGESLGENGIYLHSLPYIMAPKEQYEVPMLMWFGGEMKAETDYEKLRKSVNNNYSHDNIFHTVLGMLDIESDTYNPQLDILYGVHHQAVYEALNEEKRDSTIVR